MSSKDQVNQGAILRAYGSRDFFLESPGTFVATKNSPSSTFPPTPYPPGMAANIPGDRFNPHRPGFAPKRSGEKLS